MRLPTFTRSAGTTTTADDETTAVRPAVAPREKVDDRTPYEKGSTDVMERPATPPAPPVVVDHGPRARTSVLATVGLALSVGAAALVLSGPLGGYGIAVAVIAFLASAGGFVATRRRHVAGKFDGLIGMLVSAAALIVGILSVTGELSWLSLDTDTVRPAREWLDAQFPNWF
ncbi:hypothetical protein J2S43_006045 [Catenuloplanes nepalensis]|uniref:Thrombospondin n=1 Tax=Catenuloplanes nepalensis TaxID=587533 RepID=A0ABT9N1G3_9ACTN|nr:hypothetical protein [Catenuloplanes nepalensis]MDP9797533.1 hypothetical protein [Catenuloplanes nepalensis]